jgi:protein-S-isoprenylcysteine O-methyltransferase Ste14
MRPLMFVFPHALLFWGVFFWSFSPEYKIIQRARAESEKEGSKDAGSVKLLMTLMWFAFLIAFPLAWYRRTAIPEGSRLYVFYAGVALIFLGSVLRRICWRTLGDYFTGDVRARTDQPVIQTGPYRFVRHPSYTAGMMMNAGIGLAMTNWLSLAILLAGTFVAYGYRVHVEERALLGEIGEPYAEFMRTRRRFVPYVI